jgi:5'-3' exonuclease
MGIKLLNKLMKQYASKAVRILHLNDLKHKSIVIDISIYLYKYKSQNMLLTNIFKLCSILNHYQIDAIFVFDGRPPQLKMETLSQRSEQKYMAKQKYYDIIDNYSEEYIKTNKNQLLELKKSFTRVKKEDIEIVKNLLKNYGMKYCEAVNEADHLCGKLVNSICKDGCLSDDMDMFVYKSKYVYRNLDIVNRTCLCYDLHLVLQYLNMNFEDFKWMCVLSQNDYNVETKNVFEYYKLYKEYKYKKQQGCHKQTSFIDYVMAMEFMNKKEINHLESIHKIYDIDNKPFDQTKLVCNYADTDKVYKLLEQDNFVYPPSQLVQAC